MNEPLKEKVHPLRTINGQYAHDSATEKETRLRKDGQRHHRTLASYVLLLICKPN